jgi:type I restriction enzyme, S subunit
MPECLINPLPEGWEATTLGALCAAGGGDVQTGPFGSQLHASDYVVAGVPSVMPVNIGDNRILTQGIARVSEQDAERLGRHRLRAGDIVYSRRGDVERRALVRAREDGWLCGTGCLRVRLGPRIVSAWLSYYLGHPEVRAWIVRHAVGATMPNLSTGILSALPVAVPPSSEQSAIAEVLGALDDKIECNGRIVRMCDGLAAAYFRHAADALTTLRDVAVIVMGQSPPGDTYNQHGDGLPFYQGTRDFGFRHPRRRIWCNAPTRMAEVGDVLIGVRAPVGTINVAVERSAIGRGLAALQSLNGSTLYQAIAANSSVWVPYESAGTVFGSINKDQLSTIRLPWPARGDVLRELEETLAALDRRVLAAERENMLLVTLRNTLLPRLLSGELRVRNAEVSAEAAV